MAAVHYELDSRRPSSRTCTELILPLQPSASKPMKPALLFHDSVQKDFDTEIPDSPVGSQGTMYSNVSKRWARDTEFKVLLGNQDSLPVKTIRGQENARRPKRRPRTPNQPCAALARQMKPAPLNESVQNSADSENVNKEPAPSTPDLYPDAEPVSSRSPKFFNVQKNFDTGCCCSRPPPRPLASEQPLRARAVTPSKKKEWHNAHCCTSE